jgi:hypothetical protein
MLKDLKLAQEATLASGATMPLGAEAAQLYALFSEAGHATTSPASSIFRAGIRSRCALIVLLGRIWAQPALRS